MGSEGGVDGVNCLGKVERDGLSLAGAGARMLFVDPIGPAKAVPLLQGKLWGRIATLGVHEPHSKTTADPCMLSFEA